jgi:hypothetical protein
MLHGEMITDRTEDRWFESLQGYKVSGQNLAISVVFMIIYEKLRAKPIWSPPQKKKN